jgi:hypothetical protein
MTQPISMDELAREINTLCESDPSRYELLLENYLRERLKEFTPSEKLTILEELAHRFGNGGSGSPRTLGTLPEEFLGLFSFLLGRRISSMDLSSAEFWQRVASSLNTIFDTLNQIIGVIQVNLLGRKVELQTIRQVIGSSLEKEGNLQSLQDYLDQIREAFLVAHRAFQQVALNRMTMVLSELDPERLEAEGQGGIRFGPFLRADLFDSYREKFKKIKTWMDSDRFREELLREFEKSCQKSYKGKTGGFP